MARVELTREQLEAKVARLEEENKKLRRLVDYYLHMA